jgi:hypothetical protein
MSTNGGSTSAVDDVEGGAGAVHDAVGEERGAGEEQHHPRRVDDRLGEAARRRDGAATTGAATSRSSSRDRKNSRATVTMLEKSRIEKNVTNTMPSSLYVRTGRTPARAGSS